jgi:hypothetical protein
LVFAASIPIFLPFFTSGHGRVFNMLEYIFHLIVFWIFRPVIMYFMVINRFLKLHMTFFIKKNLNLCFWSSKSRTQIFLSFNLPSFTRICFRWTRLLPQSSKKHKQFLELLSKINAHRFGIDKPLLYFLSPPLFSFEILK